jgi:cellulose synthase/poly-beta-1,6-N-acetylglucosamine synthase-like glycosyltransferase
MPMTDLGLMLIILAALLCPYLVLTLLFLSLGRRLVLNKDYSYRPTISVFLPTYNEEAFIEKKLDNLISQTYPLTEILVYDCSTDRTPMIVENYQRKFSMIKLIRQSERIGMARTLNQAFKDSKGEIFIKTDCDSITPSKDSIKDIVANFSDEKVGGATGICIAQKGVEKFFRRFMTKIQIAETKIDSTVIAHASSILAFRQSLLEPVYINSMADDTEEFVRIRKKGYRTIVDPSVISFEEVPSEFRKRRLQKDRRSQGIIKVLLEEADMLFRFRYSKFGCIVLPIEWFVLVISPFILIVSGIMIGIILLSLNPLLILALVAPLALAFVHKSNLLSSIIDTQISGLIGTALNMLKKEFPLWTRAR